MLSCWPYSRRLVIREKILWKALGGGLFSERRTQHHKRQQIKQSADEQGLKDFDVSAWNAILLPKSATPEMVSELNKAVSQALDNPATRNRLDALGLIAAAPNRRSPQYLRTFINAEVEKWATPVKASGLKVE